MKKQPKVILQFLLALWLGCGLAQEAPQASIENGPIKAKLYLPNKDTGYYRGMRFDWSGIVPSLEYQGHSYFGQWFQKYDPLSHDAVMGPMEEFEPVGFENASAGQAFLKIGVGLLAKPENGNYTPFKPYTILDHGERKIKVKKNRVVFGHTLKGNGFGYKYQKTILLPKGKAQMQVQHKITNTGTKAIDTRVYCHNFFVMDKTPIGPGYQMEFPFTLDGNKSGPYAISGPENGLKYYAHVDNNKIVFDKPLAGDNVQLRPITGYDPQAASDYDIRIENQKTGAGVHIHCDRPISFLAFWAATKTLCPEPYIDLKVAPGESFSWTITYDFYTL